MKIAVWSVWTDFTFVKLFVKKMMKVVFFQRSIECKFWYFLFIAFTKKFLLWFLILFRIEKKVSFWQDVYFFRFGVFFRLGVTNWHRHSYYYFLDIETFGRSKFFFIIWFYVLGLGLALPAPVLLCAMVDAQRSKIRRVSFSCCRGVMPDFFLARSFYAIKMRISITGTRAVWFTVYMW